MNIISEIQRFNADQRINKLHLMYENNEQYILRKSWKEDDKTEQFFEKAKELQYCINKLE